MNKKASGKFNLKIEVASQAGFCFGVKKALAKTENATKNARTPVFTLGPLIHNPQVVGKLAKQGIKAVDNLEKAKEGSIVIRSHGVSPVVEEKARACVKKVVDATCPFVKKAQNIVKRLNEEGYLVVIVGEKMHPEVLGLQGYANGKAFIVEKPKDIVALNLSGKKKIGVVAQSTQMLSNFQAVICALLPVSSELKVFNTICDATINIQKATEKLAKRVEVMIVIGGKNSANTTRLALLSKRAGAKAYHIQSADEFQKGWFHPGCLVGVTAGASTPDWVLEDVLKALRAM